MKKIKILLLLLTAYCLLPTFSKAQQLPDYQRSRQNQVLMDRAARAKYYQGIPSGTTPGFPSFVPDSDKCGALFYKIITGDTVLCIYNCRSAAWDECVSKKYLTAYLKNNPVLKSFSTDSSANVITGPHGGGVSLTINPGSGGDALTVSGGFTNLHGYVSIDALGIATGGHVDLVGTTGPYLFGHSTTAGQGTDYGAYISNAAGSAGVLFRDNNITNFLGNRFLTTADSILMSAAVSGSYVPLTQRGANNGVATLDGSGKVPVGQLDTSGTHGLVGKDRLATNLGGYKKSADSTSSTGYQTVGNFFPKGDTRYKKSADSTSSTGYQTVGNFFPKGDTRYQHLENQRLSTSNSPAFAALSITGTGATFAYQSTALPTPAVGNANFGFNSVGSETITKANGNTRTIAFPYAGNVVATFPAAPTVHVADRDSVAAAIATVNASTGNWTLISSNEWNPTTQSITASSTTPTVPVSYQLLNVTPSSVTGSPITKVRLAYAGICRDNSNSQSFWGEMPLYNDLMIRVELVRPNSPFSTLDGVNITFGGSRTGIVHPGAILYSDDIPVNLTTPGERWYVRTSMWVPRYILNSAPTVTPSTSGGAMLAGTFYVSYTEQFPEDIQTPGSTSVSAVIASGSSGSVVVTSPSNPNDGSLGYKVYMGLGGAAQNLVKYYTYSGIVPWGTNYTITTSANTAISVNARKVKDQIATFPAGIAFGGGTNPGSSNNGEFTQAGDIPDITFTRTGNSSFNCYGPSAILAFTPGKTISAVAFFGDSRMAGTGDFGYQLAKGGFAYRAIANQIVHLKDTVATPLYGFVQLGSPSETALIAANPLQFLVRDQLGSFATTGICNYSINDLTSTALPNCANLIKNDLIRVNKFLIGHPEKGWIQATIDPSTTSTDGFITVTNQSLSTQALVYAEGSRFEFNNVLRNSGGALTITNDNLYRCDATATPATNFYSGGNATATRFTPSYPFATGTETIKVNGVTKTLTTDYTYADTATVNGTLYIGSITFVTAPGNGLSVTGNYTSIPGFVSIVNTKTGNNNVHVWDITSLIEVNASNVLTNNGGWWQKATPITLTGYTGTSTGVSSTTFVNSGGIGAQDVWRGYSIVDIADTNTAAIGSGFCVTSNTTTTFSGSTMTVTPTSGCTYQVYKGWVNPDGIHGTSWTHLIQAQSFNPAWVK